MTWWTVSVQAPLAMADSLAWLLAEQLDLAVEVQDASTMEKSQGTARVLARMETPPDERLPRQIEATMAQLGLPSSAIRTASSDDVSWRDGWKAFFKAEALTERFGTCPPWAEQDPAIPHWLVIDPGMAFGTGNHATTRGVLRVLDTFLADKAPLRMLDVGCGSAILSIAAAKLGHQCVAVEIDADALPNAQENIDRNGVEANIELKQGSAGDIEGQFPLVVANILAHILIEIAGPIQARCSDMLILSGLLPQQADDVLAAYPQMTLVERTQEQEWTILTLRKSRA